MAGAICAGLQVSAKAQTAPAATDWPTYGGGPSRSGAVPGRIIGLPVTAGWSKDFPVILDQVIASGSRVIISGGSHSFPSAPSVLAAFDAETGTQLWSYSATALVSAPTIHGDHVFVQVDSGNGKYVAVLDVATGQTIRQIPFSVQGGTKMGPTVDADSIWIRGVYFGGMEGFNRADGTRRFSVGLPMAHDWTPALYGNAVYACIDGVFFAHDAITGAALWQLDFRRHPEILYGPAQPAIAAGRASMVSFARTSDGAGGDFLLTTVDLATRSVLWRRPEAYYVPGGPEVANGHRGVPTTDGPTVYAISDSSVFAYDGATGAQKGIYKADMPLGDRVLVTDDAVIVSNRIGQPRTYIFDKATYELKLTLDKAGELSFANNVLYIAGYTGDSYVGAQWTVFTFKFGDGVEPERPTIRNLSTRARVDVGGKEAIAGFIVTGTAPAKLLIRAAGPSLSDSGVVGAVEDPQIELHDIRGRKVIGRNDNWQTTVLGDGISSDQVAAIQASTLAPRHAREPAIIVEVLPGPYTAMMTGSNNATGAGLIEIYDLTDSGRSQLGNISTRSYLDGSNVMIGGFIVERQPSTVVVRGVTFQAGIGMMWNPTLALHDGNGTLIQFNDNWQESQEAELRAVKLGPQFSGDAAIIRTLSPGVYTAVVRGGQGWGGPSEGNVLVEIYNLQ